MPRMADPLRGALLSSLVCAAVAVPAPAADEERWYKVELLVFTRDPVVTDELFPPRPGLAYPQVARHLHHPERIARVEAEYPGRTSVDALGRIVVTLPAPEGAVLPPPAQEAPAPLQPVAPAPKLPATAVIEEETPLRPTPFVALAADFRELGAGALRLSRSGGATVQFHETWLQPIAARDEAVPLVLDESGDIGEWTELQGSVLIYRSRYLHLETNLWRNGDGRDLPPGWRMEPPPLGPSQVVMRGPTPVLLAPVDVSARRIPVDWEGLPVLAATATELAPVYPYRHALHFDQRRRMKRNELHYLDHPAMGAVIKITALDDDALESWAEAELMQAGAWPASLSAPGAP